MPADIAVFLDDQGNTASMYDPGTIQVYRKHQNQWTVTREMALFLQKGLGLGGLRKAMEEVVQFLGDCKIFVAAGVVGIPYFALEKAQCSVWEFEGNPREFLNYVLDQEEIARAERNQPTIVAIPNPVEKEAGIYTINLKEVQENNTNVTSKQVLMPFISKGLFYSLEVTCSHVPPWIDGFLVEKNMTYTLENLAPSLCKVTITKNTCS